VWHVHDWIALKEASTQAEPIYPENRNLGRSVALLVGGKMLQMFFGLLFPKQYFTRCLSATSLSLSQPGVGGWKLQRNE